MTLDAQGKAQGYQAVRLKFREKPSITVEKQEIMAPKHLDTGGIPRKAGSYKDGAMYSSCTLHPHLCLASLKIKQLHRYFSWLLTPEGLSLEVCIQKS
jgi:hypothetical protein